MRINVILSFLPSFLSISYICEKTIWFFHFEGSSNMDASKQQKTPKGKAANQKQDRNKTPQQEVEVL